MPDYLSGSYRLIGLAFSKSSSKLGFIIEKRDRERERERERENVKFVESLTDSFSTVSYRRILRASAEIMPRVSLRGGDRVNGLEKSRRLVNPFIYASLFSAEHVHYETASPISLSLSLSLCSFSRLAFAKKRSPARSINFSRNIEKTRLPSS